MGRDTHVVKTLLLTVEVFLYASIFASRRRAHNQPRNRSAQIDPPLHLSFISSFAGNGRPGTRFSQRFSRVSPPRPRRQQRTWPYALCNDALCVVESIVHYRMLCRFS
jgi:hypothetical protein